MTPRQFDSLLLFTGVLVLVAGCASSRHIATKPEVPVEPASVEIAQSEPAPQHGAQPDPLAEGFAFEAAQRWPQAIAVYAAILKTQPANATALHRLGVIATLRDDHEAAAGYYRRALELDPQNAALLADAGYFLMLQQEYDAAARMLQLANQLEPDNERVINNLALLQGHRGEIDAALVLFRRVNPPAVALQNVASLHEQRGEWQLALACYLEARSVDPGIVVPDEVVAKVAALRHGIPDAATDAELAEAPGSPEETEAFVAAETDTDLPDSHPVATTEADDPANAYFPSDATEASAVTADVDELADPQWNHETTIVTANVTNEPEASADQPIVPSGGSPRPRDVALDGCCPVALRDAAQVIDGRTEFCVTHQGVVYSLSSVEAVQRFQKHPERYVPSAGGLDVVAVRSGRMDRGSLHYSTWFRNRLFLFTNRDHVEEFRSDPLRYVDLD